MPIGKIKIYKWYSRYCVDNSTPIERVHGTYRIMLLYQLGVFGSALFGGWTDPMKIVVGASGGVYTILGAHWANMAIAWSAMKVS